MPLETEIKFLAPDHAALAARIVAAGGVLHHARVHELNLRFDDMAGSLGPRGIVLRLRQDARARLTLKTMPRPGQGGAGDMKVREELEVAVSDFATARRILEGLGYHAVFAYEKYRTTYRLGACEVVLDETPIGNFAEIEGAEADVRAQAAALEFDWSTRIVDSYIGLFTRVRARLGLPARDMTFEAFAGVTVEPQLLINSAQSGDT
jgi:adenylate cyclase class 2